MVIIALWRADCPCPRGTTPWWQAEHNDTDSERTSPLYSLVEPLLGVDLISVHTDVKVL